MLAQFINHGLDKRICNLLRLPLHHINADACHQSVSNESRSKGTNHPAYSRRKNGFLCLQCSECCWGSKFRPPGIGLSSLLESFCSSFFITPVIERRYAFEVVAKGIHI